MSTERVRIEVNALQEGMFVSDLDRPWHETPFPLQGFYIREDDDIKALSDYCKYVFVDTKRQKSKSVYANHARFNPQRNADPMKGMDLDNLLKLPPIKIKAPQVYETSEPIKKEVSRAKKLHRHVYEAIENVYAEIEYGGQVSLAETESVANGMVESIVRNPDALVWLAKMNEEDAFSYRHSVNASIWALVFGRHLGLDKKRLKSLAMGVLLSHIGKIKVSQEVLDREHELDTKEQIEFESYVNHGVEMLSTNSDLSNSVVSIVKYHQERHNGTGFPEGITGERIPLLAKIAGLVDYYQNLITPRGSRRGLSPLEAVTELYELRNITFQKDLVEKFIEAVGVYPTGTLVELSSAEVGIVTGHNMERRLMPKIIVVLDQDKQPLKTGKLVDLMEYNRSKSGQYLFIRDSLPKGAYDIDETEYLLTGAKSKWSWTHLKGTLAAG